MRAHQTHPWGGEQLAPPQLKAAMRVWRLIEPAIVRKPFDGQNGVIRWLQHRNPALPSVETVRRWLVGYERQGLAGLCDSHEAHFVIDQNTADSAAYFIKRHLLDNIEFTQWLAGVLPRRNKRKLKPREVRNLIAQMQLRADE